MCHLLLGAKLGCLHAGGASAQDPCLVDTSIWRILLSILPQVSIASTAVTQLVTCMLTHFAVTFSIVDTSRNHRAP